MKALTFTLNRNAILSDGGHIIEFVKDKPVYVPPMLHKQALELGATPSQKLAEPEPPKTPAAPTNPDDYEKAVFEAFEVLSKRNKRGDFTSGGEPNVSAVKDVLGWAIDANERDELWTKFLASK